MIFVPKKRKSFSYDYNIALKVILFYEDHNYHNY